MGQFSVEITRLLGSAPGGNQQTRQGVAAPVDVAEVEHLAALEGRMLNAVELRKHLEIGKPQLARIVRERLIVPHRLDYTSKRFILVEVESFLKNLIRGVPTHRSARGSDPLPMACQKAGVPISTVCQLILSGAIRPVTVGDGRLSLTKIFVDVDDLRTARASRPGLSIEEAAQVLCIHQEVARYLARCNYLSASECARVKRIDPASIETFRQTHMAASELALKLRTSPRYAAARLSGFGIRPTIGPPHCRQVFFSRAEVSCLLTDPNYDQVGRGLCS